MDQNYCEDCEQYTMRKLRDQGEDDTCEEWICRECGNIIEYTDTTFADKHKMSGEYIEKQKIEAMDALDKLAEEKGL